MHIRFTHSQKVHEASTDAFLRLHPRGRTYLDSRRGNAWWAFSSAALVGTSLLLIEPLLGLVALGSGMVSAVGLLWAARRSRIVEELVDGAEQAPDRLRWFRSTIELRIDDDGVHHQTEYLQAVIPWSEVEHVVATDRVLVIYGALAGPLCIEADQMPGHTGIGPLWRTLEPYVDGSKLARG
ncbi:MAG: hypothetical protein AAFN74_21655 [Myxococcota bacterium]